MKNSSARGLGLRGVGLPQLLRPGLLSSCPGPVLPPGHLLSPGRGKVAPPLHAPPRPASRSGTHWQEQGLWAGLSDLPSTADNHPTCALPLPGRAVGTREPAPRGAWMVGQVSLQGNLVLESRSPPSGLGLSAARLPPGTRCPPSTLCARGLPNQRAVLVWRKKSLLIILRIIILWI